MISLSLAKKKIIIINDISHVGVISVACDHLVVQLTLRKLPF